MSKEQRRLLSRLEYQAVVDAKRAVADAVIGDPGGISVGARSEVTGKYEASEPDGSKVFGVKIDNSAPDGNAVQSLKGEAGQLYLQGRTAPPKPKFGALAEAIVPKVSVPLEIPISPFSKDGDSLSAVDIDNRNDGKNAVEPLPTHIGNTLGYLRGQIFDSPVDDRWSLMWNEFIAYPRTPDATTGVILRSGEWDKRLLLSPRFAFPESSVFIPATDDQTFVFGQAVGKFFATTRKRVLFRFQALIVYRTSDLITPNILFYVGDPAIASNPDSETTRSISAVGEADVLIIKSKDGRSVTYSNSSQDARGSSPETKVIEDEFYFDFLPGITDLSLRITLEDQAHDPNFYWQLTIIPFPNARN
jgi:hypothetical protein